MADKYFEEYLVTIKPDIDLDSWRQASGSINGVLQKTLLSPLTKKFDAVKRYLDDLKSQKARLESFLESGKDETGAVLTDEKRKEYEETIKRLNTRIDITSTSLKDMGDSINGFSTQLLSSAKYMAIYIALVKQAIDIAKSTIESAKGVSNRFVSQSSTFIDRDVRDIMGKFGVDAQTAQSLQSASDILGYDISEYSKWSTAQREAFRDLMQEYQQGLDSLDPQKLKEFNKATQEYQLSVAKFQLQMKLNITNLLVNSEGLRDVMQTLGKSMENINKILSSDAIKTGFDLLMGIINGILKFSTAPLEWVGSLFGGGSNKTTNNNVNNSITVNTTGGINADQLAIDLGLAVKNAISE